MVSIEGIYKRTKSDNYDAFLAKIGLNFLIRKAACLASATLTISKTSEGKWHFKTETTMRTTEIEFNVGEDWVETMSGGYKVDCSATLEDNTLTIIQKPQDAEGKMITLVRKFSEEGIDVTMTIEEVVCKQFYTRQ
ncbi:fatty acid-binding protein [Lepeophtheirus salmonis]|uniref:Fatty acid-binding protein n=2 Tax=Lepeophtheirus salmonis TaxID=72036 RepID=C1BS42_LEPSM|nr:fatty acid-binding protein-like [Lepeophtheirus salmonis]ACO11845.1 Fatty acid-binding protein [Lepeophtheirus salmonis]ADD38320.1 Fatty acid-binding protein [Lepeophtheirus salmonis]